MMKTPPRDVTLCNLEVVVMPNGEVLCLGRTIGWLRASKRTEALGPYLTKKTGKGAAGKPTK